jgi:hypothetical protein
MKPGAVSSYVWNPTESFRVMEARVAEGGAGSAHLGCHPNLHKQEWQPGSRTSPFP